MISKSHAIIMHYQSHKSALLSLRALSRRINVPLHVDYDLDGNATYTLISIFVNNFVPDNKEMVVKILFPKDNYCHLVHSKMLCEV